ncbi:MAG: MMPL family transporter [Chthoniobacteraceae bacterium]
MSLDRAIGQATAHFLVQRRRTAFALLGALIIGAAILLGCCLRLDTEVLNLLPGGYESVETLKVYNGSFTQTRELSFAIYDESKQADLDAFSQEFADQLRDQPWVERVLDRSPMESPEGLADVQKIALPLLFNLPPTDFNAAIAQLSPAEIASRLHRYQQEIASSPRAEMQLQLDPLGIVVPALKPLNGSFSAENTQPLASADGTLHLIMVMTRQSDLGSKACQRMMDQINALRANFIADWKKQDRGPAPQILVTGRTAYVAEMSHAMEGDIITTALTSILLVSGVFYLGFRRLRPLVSIVLVLLVCCFFAVALGAVIFPALNGIAVGFCSILVGLGVDFGMLIYSGYQNARREGQPHEAAIAIAIERLGRGIIFGALTTGTGFLGLIVSGSSGFSQLGTLIALGILLAAGLMMTLLFLFVGDEKKPQRAQKPNAPVDRLLELLARHPGRFTTFSIALLAAISLLYLLPVGQLVFQANPRSLEPKNSMAGDALRTIQTKLTRGQDPILVLISSKDAEKLHENWTVALNHWHELQAKGVLKSVSSPTALIPDPAAIAQNEAVLKSLDFTAIRKAFGTALDHEGFNRDSFASAFSSIDQLEKIAHGDPTALDWRRTLPETSSWRFILDKFFGTNPTIATAYLTPAVNIDTPAETHALRDQLAVAGVPMHFSGWSLMLADLVPWTHDKLILLSAVMLAMNLGLLIVLFRKVLPVFVLTGALMLAIGAMLTTIKFLQIPLNLFNSLAFPLVFSVGVDYGIYIVLTAYRSGKPREAIRPVLKPVMLSALTSLAGFASLGLAANPSLSGLGIVCAIGITWSLFATVFLIVPICLLRSDES